MGRKGLAVQLGDWLKKAGTRHFTKRSWFHADSGEMPRWKRWEPRPDPVIRISAAEARKMVSQGGVTIIDVRTPQEYAERHLPGAVLLPNAKVTAMSSPLLPDQEAVLLVYCYSGARAALASQKLAGLGYRHVYTFGGLVDWPYETEAGEFKADIGTEKRKYDG